MRELFTEIEIAAPRARVWELLADLDGYVHWNPFIIHASGTPRPGSEIRIRMHPPGGTAMDYCLRILVFEPQREFRWLGKMGIRGVLDGEHIFELHDSPGGGVRVVHREYFRGVLVPIVWHFFLNTKLRRGFEQMNLALKAVAEKPT